MLPSQMCDGHKMLNDSQRSEMFVCADEQVHETDVSIKVNYFWQFKVTDHMFLGLTVQRRERVSILSLDGRLTRNHRLWPSPTSTYQPPHTHQYPLLPFQTSPKSFSPPLPQASSSPPGWGVSRGRELVTPSFSLSSPCSCSITAPSIFPSLPPSLSILHAYSHPFLSLFDPLFSPSVSPSISFFHCLCSFAGSSCSWMAYWLGFLFTFTHITLSVSLSLSLYSFCSLVYCNAQASLICVFVSLYLLLS